VSRRPPDRDGPREETPKGYEVPVPKRQQFFANLKKIAKADKVDKARSATRSPKQ
jgi:hypothetical protein